MSHFSPTLNDFRQQKNSQVSFTRKVQKEETRLYGMQDGRVLSLTSLHIFSSFPGERERQVRVFAWPLKERGAASDVTVRSRDAGDLAHYTIFTLFTRQLIWVRMNGDLIIIIWFIRIHVTC